MAVILPSLKKKNMAAQTKHDQCVALEMVGMKNCEVIKMLNFCRKKKKRANNLSNSRKKLSFRTKWVTEAVVKRNSQRSLRKRTKEVDISERPLRRIVKVDLGLKPYKIRRRQLLSNASKKKQLGSEKKMLKETQYTAEIKVFVWLNKKFSTLESVINY